MVVPNTHVFVTRFLKFVGVALAFVLILSFTNFANGRINSLSQEEVLAASSSEMLENCIVEPLPNFWRVFDPPKYGTEDLNFDANEVANGFGVFAAMAANVYGEVPQTPFDLSKLSPEWAFVDRFDPIGGLVLDVYVQDMGEEILVALVFRGTMGFLDIPGLLSDASWIFGSVNPFDHYKIARSKVSEVRRKLSRRIDGRPHAFIATGHSLGGGLARHVAAAFPCVAAVVFDSSPVTNTFLLSKPFSHQEVQLYDKSDPLSRISSFFFPIYAARVSKTFQYYGLNPIEKTGEQHGITAFATAMSRTAICCVQDKRWAGGLCQLNAKEIGISFGLWCDAMPASWRENDGGICNLKVAPDAEGCGEI